jgi:hypothetical protein
MTTNRLLSAVLAGAAGALALTLIQQILKNATRLAPRADSLGRQTITAASLKAGRPLLRGRSLQQAALTGDLAGNTLFYGSVAFSSTRHAPLVGTLMGAAAGTGAVFLPEPLGLDPVATNRSTETRLMTIGMYTVGGLVAGATYRRMCKD